MKSILIVEDHPFVAEATKELIARSHPDASIVVANSAAETVACLDRLGHE